MRNPIRGGTLTPLQAAIMVTILASPAAVLSMVTEEDCKCFMCVCDLDPHPDPPEMPAHHSPPVQPPPVPSPPPPSPSPPPPAPVYYPPPTTGYYYPPQPYGYPWPTTYGYAPPVGEMYPREKSKSSGAAPRHGGCESSRLVLAVALASVVLLSLLLRPAAAAAA